MDYNLEKLKEDFLENQNEKIYIEDNIYVKIAINGIFIFYERQEKLYFSDVNIEFLKNHEIYLWLDILFNGLTGITKNGHDCIINDVYNNVFITLRIY